MSYCEQADVEAVTGVNNVAQYADLNKTGLAADVTTQVNRGIEWATEEIDNYARGASAYFIPLQDPDGDTPTSIKWLCAELVSVWLFEATGPKAVGPEHGHIYSARRQRCYETLRRIQDGSIKLNAIL
jgi:hypothetical protein